jgi:Fe-S-cluster containining protein
VQKIPQINKPSNQWCMFCDIGTGCAIHANRPKVCADFDCYWLTSNMPDYTRPDRIGFYVLVNGDIATVHVDADRLCIWQFGDAAIVIEELRAFHNVIVKAANQVTFLRGQNCNVPEKLVLEWTL